MNTKPHRAANARSRTAAGQHSRHQLIAEHVLAHGSVHIEDLVRITGVSLMTVYRDLAALEQAGILQRNRGQVNAVATSLNEADAGFRLQQNPEAKKAMAAILAPRIKPGSSVMIDDSTSAIWVLRALRHVHPLTIITNSLLAAAEVEEIEGARLFVAGGEYESWAHSTMGPSTVEMINGWQADFCVLSASGIAGSRCLHPYENATMVKKAMVKNSTTKILLLDHTKFARRALHTFAELGEFDIIVVDQPTPKETREQLSQYGAEVMVGPH